MLDHHQSTCNFDRNITIFIQKLHVKILSWAFGFSPRHRAANKHNVETPTMVDSQWNILYWGSKWIFHTVCWDAVGCDWGQPLFTLGLPMFALSLLHFLSLLWAPSTNIYFLKNLSKVPFEGHTHNPYRFKTWIGFVGQILSWELLPFEVFFSCLLMSSWE